MIAVHNYYGLLLQNIIYNLYQNLQMSLSPLCMSTIVVPMSIDISLSESSRFLLFSHARVFTFSVSVIIVCYIHRHNKTWERAFVWCSIKQETSFYCLKQRLDALHQFFVSSFSSRSRRECHISPIAYTNKSSMQHCRI